MPRAISSPEDALTLEALWLKLHLSKNPRPLLNAVLQFSLPSLIIAVVLHMGIAAYTITTPLIFARMMDWALATRPDYREGALYAAALSFSAALGCISMAAFDMVATRAGARLRDAIRVLILSRVLRTRTFVAMPSLKGAGELHNLASGDAHVLETLFTGGVSIVVQSLELAACIVLLWFQVTWASIAALGAVALFFVISVISSRRMHTLLGQRAHISDIRLGEMLAILGGMTSIKASSLELAVEAAMLALRAAESELLRQVGHMLAIIYLFSNMALSNISIIVFAVFTVGMGRPLGLLGFTVLAILCEFCIAHCLHHE